MKKVILLSVIFILSMCNMVYADDTKVKNYKFQKDINMTGVIGTSSTYFNIEKNWDVEDVKLYLDFSKSQIINGDVSSLTVLLNDTPVKSIKLNGPDNYKEVLEAEFPKDYLREGYNEVKVKAYKTISERICQDDANTANWIVLHKESYISVKYKNKPTDTMLREYPYPYISMEEANKLDTTIVVSDNANMGPLTGAFTISSGFGQAIRYNNIKFNVKIFSEVNDKSKDNLIYIGTPEDTPDEIMNLLSEEEKGLLNSSAVIKQMKSIYNENKKILLIIGKKDENIIKACKLLINDGLVKQLSNSTVTVDSDTKVNTNLQEKDLNNLTLKDLGYSDVLLEGPFSQESNFSINIPKSKVVQNGAKVIINLRYSKNLDFGRSMATIYINDKPIGSKRLDEAYADNDSIEVLIPSDVREENLYDVKVALNLIVKDLPCSTRETNSPWGFILNSSYLELPTKENNKLEFKYYPYPFVKNNSFNDLALVIPDKLNSKYLTWGANIIAYMGQDIKSNIGELTVLKAKEFNNSNKNKNLIIMGTPESNAIIRELNNDLNIKFNNEYTTFLSNKKVEFIDGYGESISTLQLIKNPYDKNKSIMAITSPKVEDLPLSINYLTELSLLKAMEGDTITIDEHDVTNELTYNKVNLKDEKENINIISYINKEVIVISLFILLSIMSLVGLFIFKYRKSNK